MRAITLTNGEQFELSVRNLEVETGFNHGEKFESESEVRDYFTVNNFKEMFGQDEDTYSPHDLRQMAEAVIENGWHMA